MNSVTFPRWPVWNFTFPQRDVRAITRVTYFDPQGNEQTLPPERIRLAIGRNGVSAVVLLDKHNLPPTAERPDAVKIEYEV